MPTLISPLAGKPAPRSLLVDVPRLTPTRISARELAGEWLDG